MNKSMWFSVLLGGAVIATPHSACAGDEGWAALGGFLGGVLIGQSASCVPRTVIHRDVIVESRPSVCGHYEWVEERYWIPGRYVVERDRCGRRTRVWEPGRYAYRKVRVWTDRVHYASRHRDW